MSRSSRVTAVFAIACAAWFGPGGALGEVALLRNGSVLEGRIERADGVYIVRSLNGELRLDQQRVEAVVESLLAGYEWRRSQLVGGVTADDHLDLAEWAIRQSLWPQAARELLDARMLAPASPRLGLLERRLVQVSEQATTDSEAASAPPSPAETPTEGEAAAETPGQTTPLVLHEGGLEQFTRRVQPILVNNCTAGGCHSGPDDSFALDRRLLYSRSDLRSTQRNLRTVLAVIDPDQPEPSALLSAVRGPHGGVTPLVGPRADEWRSRIEAWVDAIVVTNRPPAPSAEVNNPAHLAGQATPDAKHPTAPGTALPAEPLEKEPMDYGPLDDRRLADKKVLDEQPDWEALINKQSAPPKRGAQIKKIEPRDEFDPAIFNARHRRPQDDLPAD